MLYGVHKLKSVSKMTTNLVSKFIKPEVEELINTHNPDKIVIYHFFLVDPVLKVLKEMGLNIPLLTVVTDPYTAHPMWFMHKDQKYILFSKEVLENSAKKMDISEDNVEVFPYILNEKFRFCDKIDHSEIRKRFGFSKDKDLVLVIGGGDGIPKGERIVKNLQTLLPDVEYAIVCGRNRKLYEKLSEYSIENPNIKVFGYIDFVHELMSISDIVISKCGPATFMEILLSKKIPVISSYIWEQEKGNVNFLVDNKLGIYENSVRRIPKVVSQLLSDKQLYNSFLENIDNADLQNGVSKVSDFIYDF
jgi:processive 1,2-diacylglycerol beta-glucosyltransferase/1,2-diacylglycerol 3-beta-galactosyltransferase